MKKIIYTLALLALFALEAQAVTISKLYGVTGDHDEPNSPPETLFELDMADASSTFVLTLGNGGDGEEIAFNPDDGLLYHASGPTPLGKPNPEPRILETIHPGTLSVTPVTLSGFDYVSISGLTYAGSGVLLASHSLNDGLSSITTAGVATNIGATDADYNGLAFIGTTLYAVDKSGDLLRTIDPATGATLTSVTITLTGYTVKGATGLATNPIDDTLWVLIKVSETFPTIPAARALATVDPVTGVANLVGITDVVGMAGIAFVSGEGFTVTPSIGTGLGSISPPGAQSAISGQTTSFTLIPDSGYVIESVGGTCGGTLVDDTYTTNSVTANCTVVANFELEPPTKLYGVTGDGGFPAETLFRIDMTDASTTLVLTLGNGNDGEAIAFNRDDGLLYHASGTHTGQGADAILETVDLDTLVVTPISLSGFGYKETAAMTYAGSEVFLASHRTSQFTSITTAGVATSIGTNDNDLKGLAFIGTTLYAVGKNEDLLRTIDPATGATLDSVTITLPGFTVYGATGLTTNPDDNTLWALLRSDDLDRSIRELAVIDPVTGVASHIGTVDVPGMSTIAFRFDPCDPCEVTPSVGAGPGTIAPSTPQDVASNATTAFTMTPDPHYHVDFVGGTCGGLLVSNVFTTAPIYTHCEVVAYFAVDTYDLTYTAGPGGSISGTSPQTVEYNMDGTEVTAVPDAFYHFLDWSDGVLTASRTDTNVAADINVTANFEIDSYTVTSSVGTPSGTISPLGGKSVDHGSTTQFILTPASGHHIASVGGDCGGSLDGNTFTTAAIVGDCSVVANFAINTYDLNYTAGAGGSITGATSQTVNHGASGTQVTAVPNANYHFVEWSDTVSTASRTDTNVTADINVTAIFAIDTYTVTSSVGTPSGSIDPSGPQEVDHGSTTQFNLNPAANYHIASVDSTCGGSLDGSTFTTAAITAPCTVVANFTIDTFDLNYSAGLGGTVSGDTSQTVDYNTSGTQVTALPDANFHFVDWSDGVLTAARTDTNVTADINVTANFEEDSHTVTPSVGTPSGSISPSTPQTVDHNTTTQFTLTPSTNYHIDSVGGSCGGLLAGSTYTTDAIVADCTVVANFTIDTYIVTSSVGTGSGSISPLGGQPVDHGSTAQFTVTPALGYHIASVGGSCGGSLVDNTYTTNTITSACTVVANFAIDTFDLTYSAGANGSISGDTSQTVNYGASGTQVTAVPNTNYQFVDWSDGLPTASRTDTNVTVDINVTANFSINTYTVTSSVGTPSGSIDPLGGQTVDHGSTRQFTLTPATNYHIDSVTGTCGGSLAGSTYTTAAITANCTVVAHFAIDTFDLNYSAGANGSISGATSQTVDYGGDGTEVTAVPDTNYHFVDWSDAVATASRTDTNVTSDINVTANFAIDTHTVTSSVGTASGSISPLGGQTVDHGSTRQFTLTPATNYHIDSVGGTCGGSLAGSTYTTAAVTTDCTVVANFAIDTHIATSLVGAGSGSISPLGGQSVDHGLTTQFTLTPATNYHIASVGGTCGGSLAGSTYTTAAIVADCTVVANFAIDTHTATSSVGAGSGGISPLGGQSVDHGSTTQFTLNPSSNYHIDSVGGTCGGSLVGSTYTTAAITTDCTVVANFAIDTHTATSSVGTPSGSISPLGGQSVDHGSTTQFTLTPDTNYHIASVGGTCGGSLAGSTYTTAAIVADCTVVANFEIDTHTVISSVGTPSGSISPLGGQSVSHGSTKQFSLSPAPNYHIASVGGTCGGSLVGSTYTTNSITADCTVVANFTIDTHTVTSSVGAGSGSISPLGGQSVDHGLTMQFTLTPSSNYHIDSVGGTCGGSLAGSTFTTASITGDCTVVANFALDTHTATSSVGVGSGSISPLGGQTVDHGFTTQFTLTPAPNYHIDSVGGTCGGSLVSSTFTTNAVTADCTVVANFAIDTHTVTSSVGTGPGSISPLGGQSVDHGSTTQFTLTPDPNYRVASVGGTCGGSLAGSTFTTTGITADCTVVANFEIDTYTVTSSLGTGPGTISPLGGQTVNAGATVQFTLTPDPLYHIGAVGGTCGGSLAGDVFTTNPVTADCTVVANFAIGTHTVTSSVGTGPGTISPLGGQTVDAGTTPQFTLTPAANYHIDSVGGTCGGSLAGNTFTTAAVTADCTVVANFTIDTFDLNYSAGAGGSISGNTSQTVDYNTSGTQVTAVPNANYHFVDWSDGVLTAARTDTNVTTDISVTANFEINSYTVTSSVGSPSGSINPLGGQSVDHGLTRQFTVTPTTGYHISSVGGSCGGSLVGSTYTTSPITANCTVVANFAIDTFELSYTAGANGSISGTTPQTVDYGSDGAEVTAVPDANYHFVDWSDGVLTASRTDTNVMADLSVTANFAIDTFDLSYTAGPGGSITGATSQTVDHGTDGTEVTAVPLANYNFVDWSDGVLTASRTDTNVMADLNVTANFATDSYELTYTAGPGGSISGTTPQTVDHGEDGTSVLAVPNANYHFVDWSDGVATALRTDTNVIADLNVTANFALDTYELSYTAGAGGSISGTTPQTVDHGTDGTEVTAVPLANYHFVDWSDGVLTASRTDTNVMADLNVTANFASDSYELTYTAGPGGSISGITPQTVDHGTDGTQVTAVPDANYHFVNWSDGVATASRTDTNVTADLSVTANFAIDTFELTYTAGAGGSISGTTPQTVDHGTDGTEVTAVALANYHFVDWSDGVLTASRTDTNVTADINVTANFAINTYELTYTAGAGGSISGTTPQTVDHGTDGAEVTAIPDANYHFVNWSDGVATASRTDTNVMADINVTANFAIDTFELSYTAGAGGSITGTTLQTVDYGTDGTEVTAVPDANFIFVDWSDGVATASRTDTNVMADLSVTANFEEGTHTVTSSVGAGSGTISPLGEQTIDHGLTTQFTLTPATDYHIASVGGTCGGTLVDDTYTTAAITTDCTVVANFAIGTNTVTSSVGTGSGSISPGGAQTIDSGTTTEFTLTPDPNYHVESVGGTCGGSMAGNTYTTATITSDCTVVANFAIDTFELTYMAGAGGSISGTSPQTVEYGTDGTEVTAVADANYSFVDWSDGIATASRTDTNVMADISVTANFAIDTHTVTSSVGTGSGSITPLGGQSVDHGSTTQFTLTPDSGNLIFSVGGTCGGSLAGNIYTTAAITADCTVVVNFAESGDLIFNDGFE